ncbi:MAG: CHAT domain-containing protein [Lapillicoccus sp.]
MAARTYQNFDLLLEAAADGQFRARVTSSPVGESSSSHFALPFVATELENLLLKLDPGRSGTRRSSTDPQAQAAMDLGGPLFESVFADDIMLAWQRSQDAARAQGDGLRLRLRLTDAPAIAGLPWELLYDRRGNAYLAQSERTPVVRYLEVPQPPRPLVVDGALRILTVISSPTDLPELDVEAEWRRVQEALADKVAEGTVKIDRLPTPTVSALSAWLRRAEVHILHFIGHGEYDDRIGDGVLCFTDRYGRSSRVSSTILGPYLRDHDPLRLVLLNACHSARVDATDPFSGVAQGLVQQDCTAVVAMQFPISDGAATTLTGEFYGALADGLPVDQATTSARKALLADYPNEWATPVLFLRSPDGRVFDHIVAKPATTAQPTDAPVGDPDIEPSESAYLTASGVGYRPSTAPVRNEPKPRRRVFVAALAAVVLVVVGGLAWFGLSRLRGTSVSTLTGPVFEATRLSTRLSLDGNPTDWTPGLPTVSSDRLVAGGTATVRATWTLTWNDSHLYVLADVTDPVLTQTHEGDTAQLLQGDAIGFEFGSVTPQNANRALEVGDKLVLLGPTQDGRLISAINVAVGIGFTPGTSSIAGLEGAMRTNDRGYVIEAAIPWSTLGFADVRPGAEIGMNLNVSDAIPSGPDTGRLRDMVSNNPDRKGNTAEFRSAWGTLTLRG